MRPSTYNIEFELPARAGSSILRGGNHVLLGGDEPRLDLSDHVR